jgi:phosphoribosyl-ATP pyrophosphohydrolase/phosphoribosyl-AMP cyclohydrolase
MIDITKLNFEKSDGLIVCVIQDSISEKVLMVGYMNEEALLKTLEIKLVTFYSRSKKRLWTKGETSKNHLELVEIIPDCDSDALLVKAKPTGPVCHTGTDTCFKEVNTSFNLKYLEQIIQNRMNEPSVDSYTSKLLREGINKIAQKVGEEAVELVIEAKDENREKFLNEAADLTYHYLLLLAAKNVSSDDVLEVLSDRHQISR